MKKIFYCLMAIGLIDGLTFDLGIKVPEQISVVGFDDVAMADWPSPRSR